MRSGHALLNGTIVKFGDRVGTICGRVDHFLQGDCYIVRTPASIIKEQMGDLVRIEAVEAATVDEFDVHAVAVLREVSQRLATARPAERG